MHSLFYVVYNPDTKTEFHYMVVYSNAEQIVAICKRPSTATIIAALLDYSLREKKMFTGEDILCSL